jgi:hypothetical protein
MIQKLGLQSLYKTDQNVKVFARALSGLAYVREEKVRETFDELKRHPNFPVALDRIFDFFLRNYIGDLNPARFPINIWNHGNNLNIETPRTNNGIEGWHSVFQKTFRTSRYSLILLIEKLNLEEDVIRIKSVRQENGEIFVRKEKYVAVERETQRYFIEHGNNNFGVYFLFELVRFLSYD